MSDSGSIIVDNRLDQLVTQVVTTNRLELSSYYRAKTFVSQPGFNPLVSAASPLLCSATRLRNEQAPEDIDELFAGLVHEINAFTCLTQRQKYDDRQCIIARYLITGLLDEIISESSWGQDKWRSHRLRIHLFGKNKDAEQCLHILGQLIREPEEYLDLLELFYICLSLGFKAHFPHSNEPELINIKQQLFQVISKHRDGQQKYIAKTKARKPQLRPVKHLLVAAGAGLALIIAIYFAYNHVLHNSSTLLSNQLTDIQQLSTTESTE